MTAIFEYIVIGAGIEGSSTAYHLAKNGFRTLLLEQYRLPHTRGSSHGSSRITRKAYGDPTYVNMMQEAYNLWDVLQKESGVELFKKTGLLFLGSVDEDQVDKCAHAMRQHGLPYELMNNVEIQKRYPQLRYDSQWKALYDPEAGLLKADNCLRAFQTQFLKCGGILKDGDAVSKIEPGTLIRVHTASGAQYQANGMAICAGPWSKSLLGQLELQLPLQPHSVKACYWKVEKSGLYSTTNNFPCIISHFGPRESEVYGLPSDEYTDLFKFCSHGGVPIEHPDQRDSPDPATEIFVEQPKKYIEKHFKHIVAKPAVVETCIYTVTPDENFILDKHPTYNNIAIGAGFSGHGFKFASVVGKILMSILRSETLPYDMSMFGVHRFN